MNNRFYLFVLALFLLPACGNKAAEDMTTQTLLVQALPSSFLLDSIMQEITPVINTIIKQELGLDQSYDFEFFLPKERQRLTLYYIRDAFADGKSMLLSALDDIKENKLISETSGVTISSTVNFFGDNADELVIMINDPQQQLSEYNKIIKEIIHRVNEEYKQMHAHDLYDIAKSEHYLYNPHIGLGRIRLNSIKSHLKNDSQLDIIRNNIIQAVHDIIERLLSAENQALTFDKIGILDLNKREYIKEYTLK